MPEADSNSSAPTPSAAAADPANLSALLAGPLTDTTDPAGDPPEAGMARCRGLSWSWEMDFEALVTALTEPAPWNRPARPDPIPPAVPPSAAGAAASQPAAAEPAVASASADSDAAGADVDPVEAEFAELLEAIDDGRSHVLPPAEVAGRVAESLPTGPDLAGWLATSAVTDLEDGALAGMATSYRRLASWAQAGELAVVAQLAARSAAADKKIGTGKDGRPARLPEEACAQVSLALTMSQAAASWWSDLAVTLTWRLPATGAALRAGHIDLSRARLIAEATAALDEDKARAVEGKVLPNAGNQTTGQLRAALRRAVITADPKGAEQRREEAERRARVSLYPDPEGTASLAGYNLPSIRAAAAMARIGALAQAMKAAGAGGGIDLLRAQVFLGLLLGTLPYIPPAEDGPPDVPPDEPDDQSDEPLDDQPGEPRGDQPAEPAGDRSPEPPAHPRPDGLAPDNPPASGGGSRSRDSGRDRPPRPSVRRDAPRGQRPGGQGPGSQGPGSQGPGGGGPGGGGLGGQGPGGEAAGSEDQSGIGKPGPHRPGTEDSGPAPPPPGDYDPHCPPPRPGPEPPAGDLVPPGPAPPEDDDLEPDGLRQGASWAAPAGDNDWLRESRPPPAWPQVPQVLPPGPAAMGNLRPARGGLLDLAVPWSTLTGDSGEPGQLTRIGPITPAQARHLADLAAADPGVSWRAVLIDSDGRATAVSRVPKLSRGSRRGQKLSVVSGSSGEPEYPPALGSGDRVGAGDLASLIRRVTVTIAADHVTGPPPEGLPVILERTRRTAAEAAENARLQAFADAAAGGCAHDLASSSYAVPPRLREFVTARDGTCRFPTCRQPVWRCDLDHSIPYDKGGKTCSCNLGGLCRFHHKIKQRNLWRLAQAVPGTFAWTTPVGRTYYAQPDQHAA